MTRFVNRLSRALPGMLMAMFVVLAVASPAHAGPPWTEEEFLAQVRPQTASMTRDRIHDWWKRAPQYLKDRILASDQARWWPVILCNYMGYRPDVEGRTNSQRCEDAAYADVQRGASMWSPDGTYAGPSAECRARNKRNSYGQLMCD